MCNLLVPLMIIRNFSWDHRYGKVFKRIWNLLIWNKFKSLFLLFIRPKDIDIICYNVIFFVIGYRLLQINSY